MTGRDKALNLLGLACRAGKTLCGDYIVEGQLKKKSVPMLFLASDCGTSNGEKYRRYGRVKKFELIALFTKEELGHAVGKSQCVVIALTDKGFAGAIHKALEK